MLKKNVNLIVIAIIFLLISIFLNSILIYIIISSIIALIGTPIIQRLKKIRYKKFSINSTFSALLTLALFIFIFYFLVINIIPIITFEFNTIKNVNFDFHSVGNEINLYVKSIERAVDSSNLHTGGDFNLYSFVNLKISNIVSSISISNLLSQTTSLLGSMFISTFSVIFISFFFLKEEGLSRNIVLTIIPEVYNDKTIKALDSINKLLRRYFIGLLGQLTIIFILVSIGMLIAGLGFKHALAIACIAALFNVIPYIGPLIGTLLGVSIGMLIGLDLDFQTVLVPRFFSMLLVFGVVQLLDNFIVQPIIYSKSVQAHPLEIFLVILIAGNFFGVIGMIVAIPLYTIIRVVARVFFENSRIVQKMG